MSIYYTNKLKEDKNIINSFYGLSYDYYELFKNSLYKVFAYDDNKLIGAVRAISEGVETALLVDLIFDKSYDNKIKEDLIKEIEKELLGRRVMVYGNKDELDFYESLGYLRCKNAWTYDKGQIDEKEFLPFGYKFENEFNNKENKDNKKILDVEVTYKDNYDETTFEDINELLTRGFFGRPHDLNKTKIAFSNSNYVVTAYDGAKLIGIARAVSDGYKYATILNVVIDPDYQGLSIGKNLLLKLSKLIKEDIIVLNTHPGAVGFYNKIKEYRRNKYVFEKQIREEANDKFLDNERIKAMFTPRGYKYPDEY